MWMNAFNFGKFSAPGCRLEVKMVLEWILAVVCGSVVLEIELRVDLFGIGEVSC